MTHVEKMPWHWSANRLVEQDACVSVEVAVAENRHCKISMFIVTCPTLPAISSQALLVSR